MHLSQLECNVTMNNKKMGKWRTMFRDVPSFVAVLLMENNIFPFGQGKKASKVPGQYDDVLPLFFLLLGKLKK